MMMMMMLIMLMMMMMMMKLMIKMGWCDVMIIDMMMKVMKMMVMMMMIKVLMMTNNVRKYNKPIALGVFYVCFFPLAMIRF